MQEGYQLGSYFTSEMLKDTWLNAKIQKKQEGRSEIKTGWKIAGNNITDQEQYIHLKARYTINWQL